ncbi:hypothetical protein KSS87_023740, partial [Heliosperma pusillum]
MLVNDQENLSSQKARRLKHMELLNVKIGKDREMDAVSKDWLGLSSGDMGCPSQFLFNCVNSLWGFLCNKLLGLPASTAADSIQWKESELISLNSPRLLYLVPSQEKAVKARSVCKPSKLLGIHTVNLHTGSSVEHQVSGYVSIALSVTSSHGRCDLEFVMAMPERPWELVTLEAIDIWMPLC